MLSSEIINNLTEDELDFLLYLINVFRPRVYEYSITELKSYNFKKLVEQIKYVENRLTEEGKVVYAGLCQKLQLS